jgi:antitoxin StbD
MTHRILAETAASISELKKNPMATVASGQGFPVAVLNHNEPAFYCIPAKTYEAILNRLDDINLSKLVKERENGPRIKVRLDEL